MLEIFTDGSGKTGQYIYVVPTKKIVKILKKRGLTNNESEYYGVIEALKNNKEKEILLFSDSQLVVNQLNGRYKIKEPRLKVLAEQVWKLCEGREIEFKWIPREKNIAGKVLG